MRKLTAIENVWAFKVDQQENWAFFKNAFSPEECKKIIEIGNGLDLFEAKVGNEVVKNENVRKSQIAWMTATKETEWIFRRLTDVVMGLNDQFFKFNLFGFLEGIQFTKYDAPNGSYGKHTDKVLYSHVRKLSITVQLSDPKDYEGGDLLFHFDDKPKAADKEIGKLFAFPSYTLHEVLPVSSGTRYSLVAWIAGEPFK
jgi:PKHD-type hydroxylase